MPTALFLSETLLRASLGFFLLKYNKLFEKLPNQWWVKQTKRFPKTLLITDNERKLKKINELVRTENKNGLEFESYLVGNIRREVLSCK